MPSNLAGAACGHPPLLIKWDGHRGLVFATSPSREVIAAVAGRSLAVWVLSDLKTRPLSLGACDNREVVRGCSASLTKVMDFDGTVVLGQPVETREVNIRCLIPGLPQAATILAAKLAVIAAAGAGLYVAYQYTDVKGVSNWTTSAASSDSKKIGNEPARASSSKQPELTHDGWAARRAWQGRLSGLSQAPARRLRLRLLRSEPATTQTADRSPSTHG